MAPEKGELWCFRQCRGVYRILSTKAQNIREKKLLVSHHEIRKLRYRGATHYLQGHMAGKCGSKGTIVASSLQRSDMVFYAIEEVSRCDGGISEGE